MEINFGDADEYLLGKIIEARLAVNAEEVAEMSSIMAKHSQKVVSHTIETLSNKLAELEQKIPTWACERMIVLEAKVKSLEESRVKAIADKALGEEGAESDKI